MNTEYDNRMNWDQRKFGHYEVWFCTFNHRLTKTGFWIRYTLESPLIGHGDVHCAVWFAFFNPKAPEKNFAIHRQYPLSALSYEGNPFHLQIADASLRHNHFKGMLEGDTHSASWDLGFPPNFFTHNHLPALVYKTDFADTKVLSPNLMVNIIGRVTVDGITYDFDGDPGSQSHLWGKKHAHAWAWGHCNAFREDPTACFEIISVRLKRFGLVTPTLTFFSLYLGSEVYHLRHFSDLFRTKSRWETGLYQFSGVSDRFKIEGEMRCRPEDLIQARYTDPDGEAVFCQNSEVANASVTVWNRRSSLSPFKKVCRLTSRNTSHFEYAGRLPDGQVLKRHVRTQTGQ